MKRFTIIAVGGWLIAAGAAHGQAEPADIAALLAAHNEYRTGIGLPPLQWSASLAARAQGWAEHIAVTGQLVHSGAGQNLAWGTAGGFSLTDLVALWGHERGNFTDGIFPEISSTGNWADAGHYSQLVWAATRQVGCGLAKGGGRDILVCDYDPPGNVAGERAY
jgi:hypothetical protein